MIDCSGIKLDTLIAKFSYISRKCVCVRACVRVLCVCVRERENEGMYIGGEDKFSHFQLMDMV